MDTIILNNDDILQLSEFCIFHILLHLKSETQSTVKRNKPQVLAFSEAVVFVSNNRVTFKCLNSRLGGGILNELKENFVLYR